MTALMLGLLSGWILLQLAGAGRAYPWRIVDLEPPAEASGSPDRPGRLAGRRPAQRRRAATGQGTGRATGAGFGIARTGRSRLNDGAGGAGRRRRRERRERREVESDLPAAVDLLHVAVTAGHTLHGAVSAVARSGSGPVGDALAEVDRRFRHGSTLVEELDRLPDRLGPAVRPLSTTLVVASSSGTPLGPTLQRLADAERRRVRRRTEERVRRLPVLLLAPLIGLVLPAFVLLTVVPVAITTARAGLAPLDGPPAGTPDLPSSSPDTFRSPP